MDEKRIPIRVDKSILKLAQRSRHVTQEVIANTLNMKRSSLCQNMSRPRMSLGMFAKILDALDYDVVVVNRETGEAEWQLYVEHEQELDDDI